MTVVGVGTDEIVGCLSRFTGFPGGPAAVEGSGPVEDAADGFAGAWGRAGGVVVADEGEFVARLRRAAALYAEADASLADAARKLAA
jgi:hypothetical protein